MIGVIMELKGVVANKFDKEIKGICRIIFDEDINSFNKGEILVTESTSPRFLPAMLKAKAIITEYGGLLSHSAITSREFNIPCIVNVKDATDILKDGDIIVLKQDGSVIWDE